MCVCVCVCVCASVFPSLTLVFLSACVCVCVCVCVHVCTRVCECVCVCGRVDEPSRTHHLQFPVGSGEPEPFFFAGKLLDACPHCSVFLFSLQGAYFMLVEHVTQLYRSLLPITPWVYFLLEQEQDGGASGSTGSSPQWFCYVLLVLYVLFKVSECEGSEVNGCGGEKEGQWVHKGRSACVREEGWATCENCWNQHWTRLENLPESVCA